MRIRPGNSRDVRDSPLLGECRGASVSAATPHDELVASTPRAISSCLGERSLGEHIPWIPLDRIQASHPCERYYQARQPPPQRGADSLPTRRLSRRGVEAVATRVCLVTIQNAPGAVHTQEFADIRI